MRCAGISLPGARVSEWSSRPACASVYIACARALQRIMPTLPTLRDARQCFTDLDRSQRVARAIGTQIVEHLLALLEVCSLKCKYVAGRCRSTIRNRKIAIAGIRRHHRQHVLDGERTPKRRVVVAASHRPVQIKQPLLHGTKGLGPIRQRPDQSPQHLPLVAGVGADRAFAPNGLDQTVRELRPGVILALVEVVRVCGWQAVTLSVN